MCNFQRMWAGLFDHSINRITVLASFGFPALIIDPFANLSLPEVVDVWVAKFPEEVSTVVLRKQYSGTVLHSLVTASLAKDHPRTLQMFWSIVMIILKYPIWNAGNASLT